MNKIILTSLIAAATSVFALTAEAKRINVAEAYDNMQEQIRGTSEERMAAMDKNKDGFVTRKEYIESEIGINNMRNKLMFEDIDTDKDGKINVEDYYTALSIRNYQLLVRIAKAAEEEDAKAAAENKSQEPAGDPQNAAETASRKALK
jgi:hypothetical protein